MTKFVCDGKTFDTLVAAKAHASDVFERSGNVIAIIEKKGPRPVFVLKRVPDADCETIEWTDLIRTDAFRKRHCVVITYESSRELSRWSTVARKRPFTVYFNGAYRGDPWSRHATFKAALKAAHKLAKEE